jgi:hypothetical protein
MISTLTNTGAIIGGSVNSLFNAAGGDGVSNSATLTTLTNSGGEAICRRRPTAQPLLLSFSPRANGTSCRSIQSQNAVSTDPARSQWSSRAVRLSAAMRRRRSCRTKCAAPLRSR